MEHIAPDDSDQDDRATADSAAILTPEQLRRRDDDAIVAALTGQVVEDYVYSLRQDGRVVEGLTHAGVAEVARLRGGIHIDDVKCEERETSWTATVRATGSYTGASRVGAHEQPKQADGVDDAHAFTKVVHKAQRNAVEQLLPTTIIREFISSHRPGRASGARAPSAPQRDVKAGIGRRQKAAFAIAQRLRDALERREISQEDLWNFVRRRFNVQSRNDMREEQWALLVSEWDAATTSKGRFEELVTKVARIQQAERDASEPARPAPVPQGHERDAPEEPDEDDEGTVGEGSLDEDKSESVESDSARPEE